MDFDIVKGIGPKTKEYLAKLNIYSISDLVHYYPFRYNVLARSDLNNIPEDGKTTVDGVIDTIPRVIRFQRNRNKLEFRLQVQKRIIQVIIYNRAFMVRHLSPGKTITVIGKYDQKKNILTASDLYLKPLGEKPIIDPVYYTTMGLNQHQLKKYIDAVLEKYQDDVDLIPMYLKEEYHFLSKMDAIRIVHKPININLLKKARLRLKYEELFIFMLKIVYLRGKNREDKKGIVRKIDVDQFNKVISHLPFELTIDQRGAIDEIVRDLESNERMNRLLQGDVGSGKTVVAMMAIYANALSGYQSALMVPTELLAKQHAANIKKMLEPFGIRVDLLTSSLKQSGKKKVYEEIKLGNVDVIVGTHALIQEGVIFHNLGLVITDEQHRFGVRERNNLRNKGEMPDVLYMSATPIPRTYALTIYGDMNISNIKSLPKGRKEIITLLKKPSEIRDVLMQIKEQLELGHQVYIVAPLASESDKLDLTDVNQLKHKFNLAFKDSYQIEMIHGKLKIEEKERVMNDFLHNKCQLLISTTVIEVGVDVKNATMMVIFDADRFGLSTLHQLRGRVGRSEFQSYCILISDKERERLKLLTKTGDGFEISEADFKLRGQGDLFGVKQSGDMNFKIADIRQDFKILLKAKEDATHFIEKKLFHEYPHIEEELRKSIHLD